jgi:uncharacterized protein YcgI (DUF1989 family)
MNERLASVRERSEARVPVHSDRIPAGSGYGCRVPAGHVLTLTMVGAAQIIDLDLFVAEDPTEHLHAPTQLHWEGGRLPVGTPLWGNPPRSRQLATVLTDTLVPTPSTEGMRDHKCYGAHCNPHHWAIYGASIPSTCYDNLWQGCDMVGVDRRLIHDNLNLYMRAALDPSTGVHLNSVSDARDGDRFGVLAEVDLLAVLSLCPYGDGSIEPLEWHLGTVPTAPVDIAVTDGRP